MGWNEPGGGNRDPWSGGGNQGPPDLDEILRKAKQRLSGLFGGGNGNSGGGGTGGGFSAKGISLLVAVALLAWLASGFYTVDEGWRGVVTRFGKHVATADPGPHWHLPYPISTVQRVHVDERRSINIGFENMGSSSRSVPTESLMLTQDENIVSVQMTVQYQVGDPATYLFNFVDPRQTLKEVTESAVREVVGKRSIDDVLATEDLGTASDNGSADKSASGGAKKDVAVHSAADIAGATRSLVEDIVKRYDVGVQIETVNIQKIQPPDQVQDAFYDAIKAREDKARLINEAEAYRNEVLPKAQGQAARIKEEAQGYKSKVVADAEGDTSRFSQLAGEYEKAPDVTRERLYLETMQDVLSASGKVLVGADSGKPLMYLPLDKLLRQSGSGGGDGSGNRAKAGSSGAGGTSGTTPSRESSRSRSREAR